MRGISPAHFLRLVGAALLTGACALTPGTELAEPGQPQCASATFPLNERIAVWSVDKFAGRYSSGGNVLTVRRDQHRLLVEGWTLGKRELAAQNVESWTWHDGCGVLYEFTLPPDGPGAWLKVTQLNGATTDWRR
jgi:hypothetical protein